MWQSQTTIIFSRLQYDSEKPSMKSLETWMGDRHTVDHLFVEILIFVVTLRVASRGPPRRRSRTVGQWHHIFEHQPREASPPAMQGWSPGVPRKTGRFLGDAPHKISGGPWISGEESGAPIEAQRRLDAKPAVVVVGWVLIGEIVLWRAAVLFIKLSGQIIAMSHDLTPKR